MRWMHCVRPCAEWGASSGVQAGSVLHQLCEWAIASGMEVRRRAHCAVERARHTGGTEPRMRCVPVAALHCCMLAPAATERVA